MDSYLGYEKSDAPTAMITVTVTRASGSTAAMAAWIFKSLSTGNPPLNHKRHKDISEIDQNWDAISPIFKFSEEVRKVIYTTNAIESLNSTYRKLNRQRALFPSDTALLKALYLATFEATKKWTMPICNWGQVYGELSSMYEGRLPE